MKLGVLTAALYHKSLAEALSFLHAHGVETVEIGAGGFPGKTHLDPDALLENPKKIESVKALLKENELSISAISAHGNALHPQKAIAESFHRDFENAVLLAEKLGVDTVVTFSGCPGDSENSQYPNWVTCAWPEDFQKILDYQWNDKLIPYWKKEAEFAAAHGVTKIAFEMHPGFCVYNPETLLRLRAAVGDRVGANFDPSHMVWQGIDPTEAIRLLGSAIYHFHAKDTYIDEKNTAENGVLDTKHYGDIKKRAWTFRTVGYGNDTKYWKKMISMLRIVGYDGAISIEHEDPLMHAEEGLLKAVDFLKRILIREAEGEMFWA